MLYPRVDLTNIRLPVDEKKKKKSHEGSYVFQGINRISDFLQTDVRKASLRLYIAVCCF